MTVVLFKKRDFTGPSDFQCAIPAQITDHDEMAGFPASKAWPSDSSEHSLRLHLHFCELIHAWNLSPYRREAQRSQVASVNQEAETRGESQFSFVSLADRTAFVKHFGLDDFVSDTFDPKSGEPGVEPFTEISHFYLLTLNNKLGRLEINAFFRTYQNAMNNLSIIETERRRAISNDGNRVGFITSEHFAGREMFELSRIRTARVQLGAGQIER